MVICEGGQLFHQKSSLFHILLQPEGEGACVEEGRALPRATTLCESWLCL